MKKIVLLVGIIFIAGNLNAQQLSGKILNENNEPVSGATIRIDFSTEIKISDQNGFFEFKKLKAGIAEITVQLLGYETYKDSINISKPGIHVDITLKIAENLTNEVIVSALRVNKQTPVPAIDMDKEELQKNNLGKDVPYLLSLSPSVTTSSDGGNGIGYSKMTIRGTDLTRINVTVNGIPLNDAESHGVYWVDLPDLTSSIENVQIQRGVGASTIGAGAFGANINFMTTALEKNPYAQLSGSFGSFNSSKTTINAGTGLINKHVAMDLRLSNIHTDGYIDRARADLESIFASASYTNSKTLVKMNLLKGKEETYQAWYGIPKDTLEAGNRTYNFYTYANQVDNYKQDHYQAFISRNINARLIFNLAFNYTKGKGYYEEYKNNEKLSDYQIDNIVIGNETITTTDLVRRKWLDNDFYVANMSLNYEGLGLKAILGGSWQDYFGRHYGTVIWARFSGNSEINQPWYYNTGDKSEYSLYTKLEYILLKRLHIYADIQYRHIDYIISGMDDNLSLLDQSHFFSFLNPKIGMNLELNDAQNVYLAYGRANREPSRTDFKDAPNDLVPVQETLDDFELGYHLSSRSVSINLNFYYMNYKDQLVKTGKINDVGDAIMTNVPKSYRTGIEFAAVVRMGQQWHWNLNATVSKNKIIDFTEFVDNWDEGGQNEIYRGETDLSFSPEIIAGSELAYKLFKGFNISVLSKYVGKQYIDNSSSNDRMLNAYFVNDIRFVYSVKPGFIKSIDLQLMVNNVFNVEYETDAWVYRYYYQNTYNLMDGYFPQAGIHFMAGLVLAF